MHVSSSSSSSGGGGGDENDNNTTRKDQRNSMITALIRFERSGSPSAIFVFGTINYPTSDIITSNGKEEGRRRATKIKNLRRVLKCIIVRSLHNHNHNVSSLMNMPIT